MRSEAFCDCLRFPGGEQWWVAPIGAASRQGAGDVNVDMRNRLERGNTVVLPHRDTFGVKGANYRGSGANGPAHDRRLLLSGQVHESYSMLHRNDEHVWPSALLMRDHERRQLVALQHRAFPLTCQVLAEGARHRRRKNERHRSPDRFRGREPRNEFLHHAHDLAAST